MNVSIQVKFILLKSKTQNEITSMSDFQKHFYSHVELLVKFIAEFNECFTFLPE